ncbi:hypothetical protein CXB49_13655 [Chromobacterium sp. ATCC 53434]|uniref:hypothetical protein n=1 Tax=Chromobacterium sp. (strain ATCC 53434 / SC 14030) TaxID=2059672 RepID=UPI000C75D7AC|nr:hypothetical protein [Chromobacterium sp. ATCC 53434]AUH51791.1 hypothetical protein CXB49_13655 [Chromobacterium sp. ATCC 53434]
MDTGLTPSEALVNRLSTSSFLRLWTHPNPVGKGGKELCDCLVVCGPHIIILSVKEIEYRDTGDKIGWERWQKAAIDKSVKQIWGAERWLRVSDRVVRGDGREVMLPPKEDRQFHRVTISLGGRGEVPLKWGDFGHGFVHLLDELSLEAAFSELTTITDFVRYLSAVENIFDRGVRPVFSGGGAEDLLALYVQNGSDFGLIDPATNHPVLAIITEGIWAATIKHTDYLARNRDLESSYAWDRLIESYVDDLLTGGMFDMFRNEVTQNELALVAMALQPRGHRANLADSLLEFLRPDHARVAARVVVADNDTAFVFTTGDTSDREHRSRELFLRCFVVRGRCKSVKTIVGIAIDRPQAGKHGHSSDILYLHMPIWDPSDDEKVKGIQSDLGYFKDTKWPA